MSVKKTFTCHVGFFDPSSIPSRDHKNVNKSRKEPYLLSQNDNPAAQS